MLCKSPVLLIFFNRPETLKITFEKIRKARPRKLYLAQDGPRDNCESDPENIKLCREIVDNIDWECQVFRNYSEENMGCGRGPYSAISWFFSNEECGIVLEDDCVASDSFFTFCDEMLEKYRCDERVFLITGCNLELKTKDVDSSYFFGYSGTNWGWASWKRCWSEMDYCCSFTKDKYVINNLRTMLIRMQHDKGRKEIKLFLDTFKRLEKGENISYWDVQWQAIRYLNHQLSIIPSCNLITNIGIGNTSTHAKNFKTPKGYYDGIGKVNFYYNKRYEMEFPLKHPKYLIQNTRYDQAVDKKLYPSFCIKVLKKLGLFGD